MEFFGMILLSWLVVGFIFGMGISLSLTEEKIKTVWEAVGMSNSFTTPKSYRSFVLVAYTLLGYLNIPLCIFAMIIKRKM